ncbi:Retrotransposon protein [Phytophthora megakarya]|uniref:Retrotransposon protein n=1 Tax=Phytophthora megakarya TaxID=4795 RepID=A0A225VF50_9STRA|nr:Retrotransposon protein [Phytophthora megakarya]
MMLPIYVIAHAEANGHCGAKTTIAVVNDVFTWPYVKSDVAAFVSSCSYRIPWHYGATAPNNVLQFDFPNLPPSAHGDTYILVLKDGMSDYVGLVVCTEPTAEVKQSALLDWFTVSVWHPWIFDQGSHFKNTITSRLENVFGAQHHFVTAYCPWTNGSVEVVKRQVLHAIKTLLSE